MAQIIESPTKLRQIRIIRNLLPIKTCNFLKDEHGFMSYMGQILFQLHNKPALYVKGKPVKLVSELNTPFPHFTRSCRGKIVQTDLCSSIVDMRPSPENERRLAELLKNICTIEFVDE